MTDRSMAAAPRLHGRAAERDVVAGLLGYARAGDGRALVIEGIAGIGKTSLVNDVLAPAQAATGQEMPRVLATRARRREANLPFATAHAILSPVAGAVALGRTLGSAIGARGTASETYALGARAAEMLTELASAQPVVCWLDDAQWTDPASVELLAFVAGRLAGLPIAMVMTQRPGGPDWDLPLLSLGPLDGAACRALIAERSPAPVDDGVSNALVTLAAGNPGALVALVDALTPAQCCGDDPLPEALPFGSALRRTYVARLNALPNRTRRLLLFAAADPHLTADELVRAAAAAGIDLADLEPAERDGLISVSADHVRSPEPLALTVAYEEACLAERRATHALLARVVDPLRYPARVQLHQAALSDGSDPDLAQSVAAGAQAPGSRAGRARALARAAELSNDPVAAARWLVMAAREEWSRGEPHRAQTLLRRVQPAVLDPQARGEYDLLRAEMQLRGRTADRAAPALLAAAEEIQHDPHRRVAALLRAGEALCLVGDYPEFAAIASRALALRTADEPPSAQFVFEQFAGLTAMFRGDYRTGVPALRRAIAIATAIDEPSALTRASMGAIVLGDDETAIRLAMRAAELATTAGEPVIVPQALELVAAAECALGRYDSAAATLARALPLAIATGQESLRCTLIGLLAVLAANFGDSAKCLAYVRDARGGEVSRAAALAEWALGLLDLNHGRPADAVPRLEGLLSVESGYGQLAIRIAASPHLVEAYARAGDQRRAKQALAIFDPWARMTDNPAWLALAERCQALVASTRDQADEHFRRALHQHHQARADFERARTQLLYGQDLRRARRRREAREQLREAYDTFTALDARPLADLAGAELRAAGLRLEPHSGAALTAGADDRDSAGYSRPRTADVSGPAAVLTAQQLEIAKRAADGATNREIAAALFISTRTVDYHMRNILARLGLRSRVDLAKLLTTGVPGSGGAHAAAAASTTGRRSARQLAGVRPEV
ncbi:MAG TPA: LuxR C-terminal-related transcriptional regulator [Thermomicrobiales bacterium]|nr:LuxR C-terminal-related transcriptional regulator [Thermomicrobiales bacterium]